MPLYKIPVSETMEYIAQIDSNMSTCHCQSSENHRLRAGKRTAARWSRTLSANSPLLPHA